MGRLDEIEARVNARMREIDDRIGVSPKVTAESSSKMAVRQSSAPDEIRAVVSVAAVPPTVSPEMWETTANELLQLMQYVCSSPHVTSNAKYAELPAKLHFNAKAADPTVNAFATLANGSDPVIMLLGGAIRFANLVSAAYVGASAAKARNGGKNPLPEITAALGECCLRNKAVFSSATACEFAQKYNLHLVMADPALARKAKSFAAGLLIGILAHEFGHLALGHCYGNRVNLEVSRNQEREADSFASSVISSSPFGDYLVFGTILWEAVWVWVEEATGQVATTHPLSRERLADLIRANPSVAAEFGLSA